MQDHMERAPHRRKALFDALNPSYDVRNIMSRSGQTIRGKTASRKSVGAANTESWWESHFCMRAEVSGEVKWFETQPLRFRIHLPGRGITYTPDAAIELKHLGVCLVEVKRYDGLARGDALARLTAIRHELAERGHRLLCSTERELDRTEENQRIRIVRAHRSTHTRRETESLVGKLNTYTTLTLGLATEVLGNRAAVLHLIATRHFYIDYRQPLIASAVIARNPLEANHAVALFANW